MAVNLSVRIIPGLPFGKLRTFLRFLNRSKSLKNKELRHRFLFWHGGCVTGVSKQIPSLTNRQREIE